MQFVVDDHRESQRPSRSNERGDVRLEGCIPTLVFGDQRVVHPDDRTVCGRVETEDDPSFVPSPRDEHGPLVPDVSNMVVDGRVDVEVVEAARDRRRLRCGQRRSPPLLVTSDGLPVYGEVPESVESFHLACRVVLWPKHRRSPSAVGRKSFERGQDDLGRLGRIVPPGVDD